MGVVRQVFVLTTAVGMILAGAGSAQAQPTSRWLVNDQGNGATCLDVRDGAPAVLPCSLTRDEQRWSFRDVEDGLTMIVHQTSGLCLESDTETDTAELSGCERPTSSLRWRVEEPGGGRVYSFDHEALWADGESLRLTYRYTGVGARWRFTDLTAPTPQKPGEGGSCGIRACPPPEES